MRSSSGELEGFVFEQLEPPPPTPPALAAGAPADESGQVELADVRELARAEGFEEGRLQGVEAGRAEVVSAASALGAALEESQVRLRSDAELLEWQAVELALQLADKVICAALEVTPERLLDVIRGALRGVVERERVTVLVNPDDLALVSGALDEIAGALGGIERLEAQGERRVSRGGAVLRTPVGELDARLETQLARAREVLQRELVTPAVGPEE